MPYLIDGHNLIPKVPGLRLDDLDDEEQLIRLLQRYLQHEPGKTIEVFFDRRAPGARKTQRLGRVKAHFVAPPQDADGAIIARLQALGGAARTWTVVSSDHRVQNAARAAGARVITSEEFARRMRQAETPPIPAEEEKPPDDLSIEEWEALFRRRDKPPL